MDLSDLISAYQAQVDLVDKIWGYFYSVTFALLGATLLNKKPINNDYDIRLICGGYFIFSVGSCISLWFAQGDLHIFSQEITSLNSAYSLSPIPQIGVVLFQGIIFTTVTIATYKSFQKRLIESGNKSTDNN